MLWVRLWASALLYLQSKSSKTPFTCREKGKPDKMRWEHLLQSMYLCSFLLFSYEYSNWRWVALVIFVFQLKAHCNFAVEWKNSVCLQRQPSDETTDKNSSNHINIYKHHIYVAFCIRAANARAHMFPIPPQSERIVSFFVTTVAFAML